MGGPNPRVNAKSDAGAFESYFSSSTPRMNEVDCATKWIIRRTMELGASLNNQSNLAGVPTYESNPTPNDLS